MYVISLPSTAIGFVALTTLAVLGQVGRLGVTVELGEYERQVAEG